MSPTIMEYYCDEHVNCRFVGKDEFRDMLAKYVDHVDNVIFGEYVGGAYVTMDMLELKSFGNDNYCNLHWQGGENIMMRLLRARLLVRK